MSKTHNYTKLRDMNIVGIVGKKRSGKDTIANYLKTNHDYNVIALAGLIKESLINTELGDYISLDDINGLTKFDREEPFIIDKEFLTTIIIDAIMYADHVCEFSSLSDIINKTKTVFSNLDMKSGISIRRLMTLFGNDIVTTVDPYYWTECVIQRMINSTSTHWVISDIRLFDEREFLFKISNHNNFPLQFVYVNRPDIESVDTHITEMGLEPLDDHDNVVICNDSTIEKMHEKLDTFFK